MNLSGWIPAPMKSHQHMRTLGALIVTAAALLAGGCASIIHGGPRMISVASQPQGAKATISKESGELVSVNTTPFTVTLDPKKGYFKGQPYNIRLELPGYKSAEIAITPQVSGWYWGNILFGGLIGMLAVDPVTGSMYNLSPEKIEQQLTPSQAELLKSGIGFVVVLASEVTASERASMVKIN